MPFYCFVDLGKTMEIKQIYGSYLSQYSPKQLSTLEN